jgi:2'-5' RNA ligase
VAAVPPPGTVRELAAVRDALAPRLSGLRWVAPGNLHFTLRFLGDRSPDELARVGRVVDEVAGEAVRFPVVLDRLGVFPGWSRPRVLWAGCGTGAPTLEALARTLERGFEAAELGGADKPFVAHLTLGRWRDTSPVRGDTLRTLCEDQAFSVRFEVEEVRVLRSVLGRGGPTYSLLHAASLRAPA